MKNVLVVSVNWLGDVIFSTPVYAAIKKAHPHVRITALCVPRVADVLGMCPSVDEVMVYDEDGEDRPLIRKLSLIRRLSQKRFDAVFILRKSFSRTLLTYLAGIPLRSGYAAKSWRGLFTHVAVPPDLDRVHRSDAYLKVVETVGIAIEDRQCRLSVSEQSMGMARDWLTRNGWKGGRLIALNTGGNWDLKQWPPAKFAELARKISEQKMGELLFTGGPSDESRVQSIIREAGVSAINAAGSTGLTELAAILSQVRVLVTADSGPIHLANALGTPVIGLFGPTRPEVTGPRGTGRSIIIQKDSGCNRTPCYYLECPDNRCMKMIEVADVLEAIRQV